MPVKKFVHPVIFKAAEDGAEEGLVEAVVSTFGILDHDHEIVLASAFKDGQELPLIWGHDWSSLPIGKGVISVQSDRAVFSGRLFMDTTPGLDAFRTMKNMGALQQFSWGFTPTKIEIREHEGEQVPHIVESEPHEVSAVLVGSNPRTGILDIKGHGLSYDDHFARLQVAVSEFGERTRSRIETWRKEGRAISTARRTRMEGVSGSLRSAADEIDAMLEETAPKEPKSASAETAWLRFETDRLRARLARDLGVPA